MYAVYSGDEFLNRRKRGELYSTDGMHRNGVGDSSTDGDERPRMYGTDKLCSG